MAISPEVVYLSLPDAENIDPKWSILLKALYRKVFKLKLFRTENNRRVYFPDALFFIFENEEKFSSNEIKDTLWNVATKYSENVVYLPHHLQNAVVNCEFIPEGTKLTTINAGLICRFLHENPQYESFSTRQKHHILQYLFDNISVDRFQNLRLLPTNDQTTCVSLKGALEPVYLCLHTEEKMFPLMEWKLVSSIPEDTKRHLIKLAKSGMYVLKPYLQFL